MRRTLGLVLVVPAALVLLGGEVSPVAEESAERSAEQLIVASTPAAPTTALPDRPVAISTPTAPVPDVGPPAGGTGERSEPATDVSARAAAEQADTGFIVARVPDAGGVAGSGPHWRYTVEVDPATGLDADDVARQVREALTDERSWARGRTLEQVAEPVRARIRVVLATPETVDALCARVGLRTAGIYSCWNGRIAALNAWRWQVGADGFPDITTYRTYLVNHEVGHGLGYGHVGCPAAGAPAPVMMQQSKGLADCVANGWPYP